MANEAQLAELGNGAAPGTEGWYAKIEAAIGAVHHAVTAEHKPKVPWQAVHDVWFTGAITLTAGAGTLQQKDMYGPKTGHHWDVRSLQIRGFTAGTVTAYRNSTVGEIVAQTTAIGEFTWSKQRLLAPEDQLIFTATGITGSVFITGNAIEVETAWWPEYLM